MQKTAYEMRISDWSSDVCSADLHIFADPRGALELAHQDIDALHVAFGDLRALVDQGGDLHLDTVLDNLDAMLVSPFAAALPAAHRRGWHSQLRRDLFQVPPAPEQRPRPALGVAARIGGVGDLRPEDRRVGKEGVYTFSSWCTALH